jgi:hypothetical protein
MPRTLGRAASSMAVMIACAALLAAGIVLAPELADILDA